MATSPSSPSGSSSDTAKLVESAWQDQATWSAVANELAASIRRWRKIAAIGGVAGVFVTVLASTLSGEHQQTGRNTLSMLGVLLLAVVPYVQSIQLTPARISTWTRARNVSELLKESIFRFMMGALPAEPTADPATDGATPPDPSNPAALLRRCRGIRQEVQDLAGLAAAISVAKPDKPSSLTIDGYLLERIGKQVDYYAKNSTSAALAARKLRQGEFLLGVLAVVLAALPGTDLTQQLPMLSSLAPWVGVVTTAGGAVSAHLAAGKQEHTAMLYFATGARLRSIRDEWLCDAAHDQPEQVRRLVDDIERAISSETEAWVADWNKAA